MGTVERQRRIIVNRDAGGPREWDQDRASYVQRHFTPLVGTQVDTVFWCFDEGTTAGYESTVREQQRYWETGETAAGLARAIAAGNDPPRVAVAEAHARSLEVFYSFRINGHEDSYIPAEVPAFKKDNPEFTLKGEVPDKVWAALNFAVPAVREQRLAVIREVLDKYDFDGIEIDWLRSPYYFPQHREYRYRYLLTDMMRAFRRMVDERSRELGRPLALAARVGESIEASLMDGLDVETWAREGLLDILVLGSGATVCDIAGFRRLTAGTKIRIYPCIYAYGHGPSAYAHPYPAEIVRAIAANYRAQGADGVYTFNWGAGPQPLLREIGASATLAETDKLFIAEIGYDKAPDPYYPHSFLFSPLPAELRQVHADTPLSVPLDVADPVQAAAGTLAELRLRVMLENATATDRVALSLNGHELAGATFTAGPPTDARISFSGGYLVCPLEPGLCRQGRNQVGMRLAERAPAATAVIRVLAVDLLVRYQTVN